MSEQPLSQEEILSEQAIANYLRKNPDFFNRHESLLVSMKVPHTRGTAVSLVERQVMVLRDENRHLQRKLENLIDMAKRNEALNQKIQQVVLALLGVPNAEHFFDTLYSTLNQDFQTDAVAVRLFEVPGKAFSSRPEFAEYDAEVFGLFEHVLNAKNPICGRLSDKQREYLFPKQEIASAVMIPLGEEDKARGLLVLGSLDVARYYSGMSTDLLKYLGELITQLLKHWNQSI